MGYIRELSYEAIDLSADLPLAMLGIRTSNTGLQCDYMIAVGRDGVCV